MPGGTFRLWKLDLVDILEASDGDATATKMGWQECAQRRVPHRVSWCAAPRIYGQRLAPLAGSRERARPRRISLYSFRFALSVRWFSRKGLGMMVVITRRVCTVPDFLLQHPRPVF